MRWAYLTSGRSRSVRVGKQVIELRHAPSWQLALAGGPAGQVIRALAWLGPARVEEALAVLGPKLPPSLFGELGAIAPRLPTWLAQSLDKFVYG